MFELIEHLFITRSMKVIYLLCNKRVILNRHIKEELV